MAQHEVTRTLVKSQPEVWAQCSVADCLARHMSGSFGEIRITRLEPEHEVAWEGEQVRGTVKIEPSAWGTRVTMGIELEGEVASPPAQDEVDTPPPPEELAPPPPAPESSSPPPLTAAATGEATDHRLPPPAEEVATEEPEPSEAPQLRRRLGRWLGRWRRKSPAEEAVPELPEEEPTLQEDELPLEQEPALEKFPPQEQPPAPELPAAQGPDPEPAPPESEAVLALRAALESLGQAHHRPFSRA